MSGVRVYDLARELEIDTRVVMQELRRREEPARSASSVVPAGVAQRLRENVCQRGATSQPVIRRPARDPRCHDARRGGLGGGSAPGTRVTR